MIRRGRTKLPTRSWCGMLMGSDAASTLQLKDPRESGGHLQPRMNAPNPTSPPSEHKPPIQARRFLDRRPVDCAPP